ncbi:hypothetical protein E2C01_044807 [Portunus trituberculatus]|uniref:Uncharacterized protein n=1 Tax=Portunus trituberculatus TaxID=210409 RepID=A0A5B7FWJ8_PORTR|nr:hypothetical protein [Portunus trituberculatus]
MPGEKISVIVHATELRESMLRIIRANKMRIEQIELAVHVMSQLLPCVSPLEAMERFKAELLRGFLHPAEDVRRLVLKQVCADSVCECM